jgi:hypothetical protein
MGLRESGPKSDGAGTGPSLSYASSPEGAAQLLSFA